MNWIKKLYRKLFRKPNVVQGNLESLTLYVDGEKVATITPFTCSIEELPTPTELLKRGPISVSGTIPCEFTHFDEAMWIRLQAETYAEQFRN